MPHSGWGRRIVIALAATSSLSAGLRASASPIAHALLGSIRDTTKLDTLKRDTTKRDTTQRDTARADSIRADSLRADSIARDTLGPKALVRWRAESDSVVREMLGRPGFRATQYQGDSVDFKASNRLLRIVGRPGAVGREKTLVVGDTIIYNDSSKMVTALGDTVILRDPDQQAADVIAHGRVTYDIETRRAAVTNVKTSVESGQTYFVAGQTATFVGDTSKARKNVFYIKNGIITSCDDSIPDYYFRSSEIKFVSPNFIVARPATLYIADVPVFWIPFLFQDIRHGRASGFLIPRFSVGDVVRNSSTYRREVNNLGYYVNMGNYTDAWVAMDWRSAARNTLGDPGFVRFAGQMNYAWRDRFMTGTIASNRLYQRDGSRATAVSWTHTQDFSQTSRLAANINFSTNSLAQRQTSVDPYAVLSTIRSDVRYSRKVGPFSLDLGGNRVQYPGRTQVEENYPSLSLTSPTLAVTSWLDWTPGLQYTRTASRNTDAVGTFTYRYFINPLGNSDSTRLKGNTSNQGLSISTPFSVKGFQVSASLNAQSQENNFPITRTFVDPADTSQRISRTYSRSYLDGVDWTVGFSLPSFFNNTFRIRPDVSFQNVMGGAYWVRSELSQGQFVHQAKRINTGISMTPTLFGLFPGFGPLARIRHSVTPTVRYSYSPKGKVSDEYLRALNQNPGNFIGNLAQNQVSLTLSQVFEGRLKSDTSASGEGKKLKLASINFSTLTYDFERARKTHRTGLSTDRFSYDISSDLLPGVSFRSEYSLFQGSTMSDTAKFKPYRESISASFTLNAQSGIVGAVGRLFGYHPKVEQTSSTTTTVDSLPTAATSLPVAGSYARNRIYQVPETQGWSTSINFTSQRQRPPVGGRVITYDPATYCNQFSANPLVFEQCKQNALLNPTTSLPYVDPISGGAFVRTPSRETIQANTTFHITEKWSANWSTTYDMIRNTFASQVITLQRDLHDWTAVFNITSSPNGAFYFSFYIANKAQPELRLPYQKSSYRQQSAQ